MGGPNSLEKPPFQQPSFLFVSPRAAIPFFFFSFIRGRAPFFLSPSQPSEISHRSFAFLAPVFPQPKASGWGLFFFFFSYVFGRKKNLLVAALVSRNLEGAFS